MANWSIVVSQLKKERDRVEKQLLGLNAALTAFVAAYGDHANGSSRSLSAAARRKMSLAQKRRWAKHKSVVQPAQPKRTMSAAARKKIAAAQRLRWAKLKGK
jgi:hypothetical protein